MASAPREAFWLLAISLAMERLRQFPDAASMLEVGPEELTGPVLIRDAYLRYVRNDRHVTESYIRNALPMRDIPTDLRWSRITLLDSPLWYPVNWANPAHQYFRKKMHRGQWTLPDRDLKALFPNSYLVTYWTHSWE